MAFKVYRIDTAQLLKAFCLLGPFSILQLAWGNVSSFAFASYAKSRHDYSHVSLIIPL